MAQADPVVTLLCARRGELVGGENSIGIQEGHIATLQANLTAAEATLANCVAEVEAIDRALGLLDGGDA